MSTEKNKKLGFGMMRLPRLENGKFDIETSKIMVDMFMQAGFDYYDTAWVYEGSEEAVAEALVKRYPRESYRLATKVSAWKNCRTAEDAKNQLKVSLERTGAGYFDNYLLHNIGEHRAKFYEDFDLWTWILQLKDEGIIRNWGFSFHDYPDLLRDVLKRHEKPDFIQLQINYADWENPDVRSRECYEICCEHDIPVIVMEPVRGGMLADPPKIVADILNESGENVTPASWGIRFAADLDNVVTVLSGMSSVEQMRDNIQTVSSFTGLTEYEKEIIARAQAELAKIKLIPCTGCNYCTTVCPMNVGIPGTMNILNVNTIYGKENAKRRVNWVIHEHHVELPSACIKCGACEEACPQHIKIRELLEEGVRVFEE